VLAFRALLAILAPVTGAVARAVVSRAHLARAQQCAEPFSATRHRANPLALPRAPGPDPLTGARFFVDGPAHGEAAGAIARLLGRSPHAFADSESWSEFRRSLGRGALHARLVANRRLRWRVDQLEKIASRPEVQRFSVYSEGGGPGAIFAEAEKIFCANMTADPGSIPIINTYFLHPATAPCPNASALEAIGPAFRRRVDEAAEATGRRPAVYLLELDAVGSSRCIARVGGLRVWERDLRYEVRTFGALPHTVVYLEGGYSDGNPPRYTARVLNAARIGRIRGFYTNDTHLAWTIKELRWARRISKLTHGAHFIVDTAQNGNGPKLNAYPARDGVEDLCNPPGRALGPKPTTNTGFAHADAFMWTHVPGNSSGCGGGPPAAVFWTAQAIGMAARANQRLGPGFPSRRY
jgi:Glycosyl hydrolases family 6